MTNPRFNPDYDNPLAHDAAREVLAITDLFSETLASQYDTVSYSEFKRTMLPLLAVLPTDQPFDIERWYGLISHPSLDIVVVDDATHQPIYRIPSLYHKTDNSCKDDDIEGMSVHANTIELMKTTDITGARMLFSRLADERFDATSKEAIIQEAVAAITDLNKIFADHQIPTLPDPSYLLGAPQPSEELRDGAINAIRDQVKQAMDESHPTTDADDLYIDL